MPLPGLELEVDTIALYKYNETSVPGTGYATAIDSSGNGRNLSELGQTTGVYTANITHIVNGPVVGRKARWFPGTTFTAGLFRAGDATARAAFVGSYTISMWIRPSLPSGNQPVIFCFSGGGSGETSADNYLIQIEWITSTALSFFWEHGAGINVTATSNTGMLTADVWQMLAVTVDNSGGTSTIKIYNNANLLQTITGLTKADGGSNADWYVGRIPTGAGAGNFGLMGAIFDLHVSSVVRQQTEISADYARGYHVADGSSLGLWQFNELPDAFEETAYGYHGRLAQGTIEIIDPLVNDGGQARHFDSATEYDCHWGYETFRSMLTTDYTYECICRMDNGYTTGTRGFWVYGDPGPESLATNFTSYDIEQTTRKLQVWCEAGAGQDDFTATPHLNTVYKTASAIFPTTSEAYNVQYIATTHKVNLDGSVDWNTYRSIDGVVTLIDSGHTAVNYEGGTGSWLRLGSGYSGSSNGMVGTKDSERWTGRIRTIEEMQSAFDGAGAGCACNDIVPPIITNVNPPVGTAITKGQHISFDVTDDSGSFRRILPCIYYANLGGVELVHDGETFTPNYIENSTRSVITDGFHYDILRASGWPDVVKLIPFSYDLGGNEEA